MTNTKETVAILCSTPGQMTIQLTKYLLSNGPNVQLRSQKPAQEDKSGKPPELKDLEPKKSSHPHLWQNQRKRVDSAANGSSPSIADCSKRVRFDFADNKTIEYENPLNFEELIESGMWYTTDELQEMMERTFQLAKDILQAKQTYVSFLNMLCRIQETYFSNKKNPNELTMAEKLQLQQLAVSEPDNIGMELWAMHHNRKLRHRELVLAVMVVQGKAACCFASVQATEEHIRKCSEGFSRPSQLVAQLLAESRAESSRREL